MKLFNIITVNDRNICTKGVGKLFYEQGFPLSQTADILKEKGIEISWFNVIDEFWNNGWSWETIEMKLIGEQGLDILGSMKNNKTISDKIIENQESIKDEIIKAYSNNNKSWEKMKNFLIDKNTIKQNDTIELTWKIEQNRIE